MNFLLNERHEWTPELPDSPQRCVHCDVLRTRNPNVFVPESYCRSPRVIGVNMSLNELNELFPGFPEQVLVEYERTKRTSNWTIRNVLPEQPILVPEFPDLLERFPD
jgi:hypothetical protein